MRKVAGEITSGYSIVLMLTFLSFCAFYAPQPLLPMLAVVFDVNATAIAWIMTAPFLLLATAPMLIGKLLQHTSARQVLTFSAAGLGLSLWGFSQSAEFEYLLFWRLIQSLMFPLLFTAAVTFCSQAGDNAQQRWRVAVYISATIIGGFVGRIGGGFIGSYAGWEAPFQILGSLTLVVAIFVFLVVPDTTGQNHITRSSLFSVLKNPVNSAGLTFIVLTFFTFVGSLNALPFRLVSLQPDLPASIISLVYLGYVVGVVIAVGIGRIIQFAGGEIQTLKLGLLLLSLGLLGLFLSNLILIVAAGFVLSAGMFTIHATMTGFLNARAGDEVSLVNGAYIAVYYGAGALGSLLPLFIFYQYGWQPLVAILLCMAVAAIIPLQVLANRLLH